ncbi:MAG: sugar ABC transporter permease [Clostridia bacterium]|nr:sugar ABC transporter permease [Clostridia bacterium]
MNRVIEQKVKKEKRLSERILIEFKKNKYLYMLSIPIFLYFILFKYLPMFGLTLAFKDYNIMRGVAGSEWVGLKYFKEFFSSVYFGRTLLNTLIISIMDIAVGFPMPIIFALLLNELRGKYFKKFVQTASYLPHFISMVVICGMITDFFSTDGLISTLISKVGGENMNYVGDPAYFRQIFVGTNAWQQLGWNSIIYIAALAGVDRELYEAATVDGAGRWRQLIHVTLPGISGTIIIMLIMRLGQVLSVGYEKIILLYTPQTYDVADVISSYTYRAGIINNRYSYSISVGMFQSVINVIILLTANTISKKVTETSLF